MFRKSLVPSILFLSITALSGMTSAVQAQVSVPFAGTVAKVCTFGTPISGVLTGNATIPTQLSSSNASGIPGNVTVSCNTAATVSGSVPKVNTGLTASYTLVSGGKTGATVDVGLGDTPVAVNLTIDNGKSPIPAGDYAYNVTVTATPK